MQGLVVKSTGSWYNVLSENKKIILCRLKGTLRLETGKFSNPIAVGDTVEIELEQNSESGLITALHDRKNYICRSEIHRKAHKQIIAANIDFAVIVASLVQPRVPLGFIDRFTVLAEAYHIKPIIIFNKLDLYAESDLEKFVEAKSIYESIGYKVFLISVKENLGLTDIKKLLQNKTSLVSGQSGVGKSAFINALQPSLQLKTNVVSNYNEKGKHTTTFAEMFSLENGGYIIDTPGVKELGIADIDVEEVSHYFVEMRKYLPQCKFNNCKHIDEPDCEVKKQLEDGNIHPLRFSSYLSILDEINSGLKFWEKK
jgi:ribosome biogenesis GTPase / thiamine phosphate phosphatase